MSETKPLTNMLVITDAEMRTAWQTKQAVPLHPVLSEFMRFDQAWWMIDGTEWVRITDPILSDRLDVQFEKMSSL